MHTLHVKLEEALSKKIEEALSQKKMIFKPPDVIPHRVFKLERSDSFYYLIPPYTNSSTKIMNFSLNLFKMHDFRQIFLEKLNFEFLNVTKKLRRNSKFWY